jgi:hypothetical protein
MAVDGIDSLSEVVKLDEYDKLVERCVVLSEQVERFRGLYAQEAHKKQVQKWDTLWRAACAVMAAHEQYTQPNTPRPMPGIFRELDHLDEQCAKLRRVIEDICPDPTRAAHET